MTTQVEVFKHQEDFLFSEAKHTGLIGGYGSGKSFAGVLKTCLKKIEYNQIPVAYYLPTYGLIKDIAFPKFAEQLTRFGIQYTINRTDKDITTPFGMIYLRSMDNPESIVGYEVGYSLIDETDILPTDKMTDVFAKIIARNRLKLPNGDINKTDVVGTPEGFKWAYRFFVKDKSPDRVIINGKTKDNTTLPSEYMKTLQDVYSPEQLDAYLDGKFVNLTSGTVYRSFNRFENHTDREADDRDVLHIGMDFNVTNMHATIIVSQAGTNHVVDEVVKAYDTFEMCGIIRERYPNNQIVVYPDAAGGSRKTSGKSDHDILKQHGFKLRVGAKNPFVRDRVNAVNSAFMNGTLFINTSRCPTLTEALENQAYNANGEPDKTTGYDHINESLGYFVTGVTVQRKVKASFSY
ncbi:phage terminase large subunit [Parapedobacter lycopersici]|uniref:phage terminase large subunit n=1 Tax=Parapedobacter lycopersici TaxID=1864939 RepID=UPI00214D9A4C|nr:phage terminase large subunit [Parapedobacter lycopersici]